MTANVAGEMLLSTSEERNGGIVVVVVLVVVVVVACVYTSVPLYTSIPLCTFVYLCVPLCVVCTVNPMKTRERETDSGNKKGRERMKHSTNVPFLKMEYENEVKCF